MPRRVGRQRCTEGLEHPDRRRHRPPPRGRTDLRGTDVRGTDVRGTDVRGTDLRGTDVRGTDLRGAADAGRRRRRRRRDRTQDRDDEQDDGMRGDAAPRAPASGTSHHGSVLALRAGAAVRRGIRALGAWPAAWGGRARVIACPMRLAMRGDSACPFGHRLHSVLKSS
ncbi:pentapeptide repeat-containing protein [Agromyces silvae]|uniref:pentapeptide repeat-containing protein n=1 Tax=Agromyces silvae TaxID=3388266 RepID=UPI0035A07A92